MTPATDDDALGAAFEALLAGRSAPPAAGGLAAFTDGVRATAARPPRPSAALADLLATGLLTDQSSATAPAVAAHSRRRRSPMFLSSLLGKLASLGLLAKTGAVAGVVVVGVSTAGFTENLPAPLQTTWDQVVAHDQTGTTQSGSTGTTTGGTTSGTTDTGTSGSQTGTGTTGTTTTTGTGTTGTTTTTGTGTTGTTGTSTTGGTTTQPAPAGNGLGATVAGKVEHGEVDGNTRVSDLAHNRNQARRDGTTTGTTTGTSTGTTTGTGDQQGDQGDQQGEDQQTAGTSGSHDSGSHDSGSTGSTGSKGGGHGDH